MRLAVLFAALVFAACAPTTNTNTASADPQTAKAAMPADDALAPPTPSDITLHIRAAQNGQVVQTPVNQRFAIELVGVPTAGYQWSPVQMPAFITRVGDEITGPTIRQQTEPGFTGGDHWEVYTFAATGPGSGEIVLEQRRPFERGAPSATFRVTITAQ
jgi:predicted secreted protein